LRDFRTHVSCGVEFGLKGGNLTRKAIRPTSLLLEHLSLLELRLGGLRRFLTYASRSIEFRPKRIEFARESICPIALFIQPLLLLDPFRFGCRAYGSYFTSKRRGQRTGKRFSLVPFLSVFNDLSSLPCRGELRSYALRRIQSMSVDLLTPAFGNLLLLNECLFINLRDCDGVVAHGVRFGDLASLFGRSTKSLCS
jgi:hypothetical protein